MSSLSLQGYVRGQVQGVGFRQATVRQANKLGIDGWVRNLPDGSVEVMLCGEASALEAMTAWLHTGPVAAKVDSVELAGCPWQDIAGFVQL
ncbi:MAG: acylphosphatase [Halopseudomonas sp.]